MKMNSLLLAIAVTVLIFRPASAQELTLYKDMPAGVYNIDKKHASVTWKVSHAGLSNYTARFKSIDADITFNPENVEESSVIATIEPTSLETDFVPTKERDFNKDLTMGDKWFNAGKFPKIVFTSTKFEVTGNNTGKIYGDLTLLGVTKPVTLDIVFNGAYAVQPFNKKPTLGFSATTSISRSAWGMSNYAPLIGDKVTIIIEAEFNKK